MNAEEVCQMLDAINEGEYFAHGFPAIEGSHSLSIEVGRTSGQFWFSSFDADFLAKINDPRVAREIAGALIAWANREDGNSLAGDLAKKLI
jgi:hypothetical protein